MRLYSPDRRYGLFVANQVASRRWTNYDVNGNSTGSGTLNGTVVRNRWYRADHTSNKILPLSGFPGTLWRKPSNYSRTVATVDLVKSDVSFVVGGKTRRVESGYLTDNGSAANYGPHISSSMAVVSSFNTDNRCNTEALLKLKDMKVNFGTALAESRQTVNMIASSTSTLIRAALAAKRGQWGRVGKLLLGEPKELAKGRSLSHRWLEYQYGWAPLMSDIHSGWELAKEGFRKEAQIFSVQRTITDRDSPSKTGTATRVEGQSIRRTRVKLYARIDDANLSHLTSLGLLNPLEIAWELVPYSFVIDWFLPVGNVISSLDATRGMTFIGGFRSYEVESIATQYWRPPPYLGTASTGEFSAVTSAFASRRVALTSFPVALPYLKSPFSSLHLANALALLRNLFR